MEIKKLHCFRRAYSDTVTVSQHCPAVGVRYIVTIWYNKKLKQYHIYLEFYKIRKYGNWHIWKNY